MFKNYILQNSRDIKVKRAHSTILIENINKFIISMIDKNKIKIIKNLNYRHPIRYISYLD